MIPFVDISYAQGNYNMAANTDPMVMMKASGFYTGSLQPYIDSQLVNNYANAIKYHKIPFMYHFFVPEVPALTQAAWFLRCVSPLAVGDGYAVDVEIDGPNLVQDVLTFVQKHHENTGCYPWVYINRYLRQKYDWSPVFALCSEWIAAPDVSFDANIPGVGIYVAQQGPIINGVDTDEYFGTLESLRSYTYGYVKPTVSVAPAPKTVPSDVPAPVQSLPSAEPVQEQTSIPSSTPVKTVAQTPEQSTTMTTVSESASSSYITPTNTPPANVETKPTLPEPTSTTTLLDKNQYPKNNTTIQQKISISWWKEIIDWLKRVFHL